MNEEEAAPPSRPLGAVEPLADAPQIIASSAQPSRSTTVTPEHHVDPFPSVTPPRLAKPASLPGSPSLEEPVAAPSSWNDEITSRVANYRRRRSSPPEPAAPGESLALDFEAGRGGEISLADDFRRTGRVRLGKSLDVAFDERSESGAKASIGSFAVLNGAGNSGPQRLSSRSAPASSQAKIKAGFTPISALDSDLPETLGIPASDFAELVTAPLGKRFWAGFIDGLFLLAAGGLFALLFWLVGGHIERTPTGFAIIVSIGVFWLFVYFASFSAIAFSTPGQSLMGLSLRNFDGGLPGRQECFLRAFGYLVSIASLMLGFLWAAMDSNGLAWHDHISGTFLADRERFPGSGGLPN